jgi:hypothetical protein
MHLRRLLTAGILSAVFCASMQAQNPAEALRVALWYAKVVSGNQTNSGVVVFRIPERPAGATSPAVDAPDWAVAFREAGLPVIREFRWPRGDTLVMQLGGVRRDSVTATGTFYMLAAEETACDRDGGYSTLRAAYVICDSRMCRVEHETFAGTGLQCPKPN